MATTVAQHSVATFTSPVNGTTPIDANTVRGNDNTIRVAYNDHDADPGIHVQSSTLASRPVAGTAGRKWITTDAGSQKLWYDDGTDWHEVGGDSINLYCKATQTLAKGDVVKITGYNTGQNVPEVAKVSSASDVAFGICETAIANGSLGYVINTGVLSDVNTAAFTLGDILYPNTSGGLTTTKPTSGSYQPVAYVLRANTNNGVLYVEFSAPRIVEASANTASTIVRRDASGNFSAGTVTVTQLDATTVNTTTLDLTNLEVTNIKAKDGTAAATIADSTGVLTISAAPVLSALTASQAVFTNGSKALVSNAITGTGNVVMSASPTLSGTISAANLSLSGTLGVSSTVTFSTPLADSNLATIATAGKVSNSATTATSANTASAIVARDASGNFSAGTITAALTGNASTATALQTARNINGVSFNGTADITVTAAAGTLTGTTLASNVVSSSLTSVGTLSSLTVSGNVTVDTDTLFVNASANRVGIGTASPKATLHVNGPSGVTSFTGTTFLGALVGGASSTNDYSGIDFSDAGNVVKARIASYFSGSGSYLQFGTSNNYSTGVTNTAMSIDPSGNLAVDTNTLYVDAVNNRVGVGTASPLATVDVRGNAIFKTSNETLEIGTLGGAGAVYLQAYGASNAAINMAFYTGTSEKMRIDASGNLGLGVTPSAWSSAFRALHVSAGCNVFGVTSDADNVGMTANAVFDATDARWEYIGTGFATLYQHDAGKHMWSTAPSGTAGNAITFTQALTLDASGNLGLGTDTPGTALGRVFRINGASSGTNTGLIFSNALTDNGTAYSSNTQFVLGSLSAIPTVFVTNNAERARIDTSGNLLVGATSSPGILNKQLVINSGASSLAGVIMQNNATGTGSTDGSGLYISGTTLVLQNFENDELLFNTNGTNQARITNTGNFGINNTAPSYKLQVNQTSGADRNIFAAQVTGASNGFEVKWNHSTTKTHIIITDIPTSSAGLPAGCLYSDGGTIKIA